METRRCFAAFVATHLPQYLGKAEVHEPHCCSAVHKNERQENALGKDQHNGAFGGKKNSPLKQV